MLFGEANAPHQIVEVRIGTLSLHEHLFSPARVCPQFEVDSLLDEWIIAIHTATEIWAPWISHAWEFRADHWLPGRYWSETEGYPDQRGVTASFVECGYHPIRDNARLHNVLLTLYYL
ncbi:MAG: hypothetical protein ABSE36_13550 [Terracidiphilus sp.]|jgi:hypothetical protein